MRSRVAPSARAECGEQLFDQTVGYRVPRFLAFDSAPGPLRERVLQSAVVKQRSEGVCQTLNVFWIDQQAKLSVVQDLRHCPDACRDAWYAVGHGLEDGESVWLETGRKTEDRGSSVQVTELMEVVHLTKECDTGIALRQMGCPADEE